MSKAVFGLCVAMLSLIACTQTSPTASRDGARTISLTFDDVTRKDGAFFTGVERTRRLIESLDRAGVREAMFFVTTGNVDRVGESAPGRIKAYVNAGHALGNHSHSHKWLWKTDIDEYIADLDLAIAELRHYENVQPYYRFPFLDEGRSLKNRDELRSALKDRGLRNGYVTVDTYDWYLDALACPSSNKWNRRSDYLVESFVPHCHVTRRAVDSANDVLRWSSS